MKLFRNILFVPFFLIAGCITYDSNDLNNEREDVETYVENMNTILKQEAEYLYANY